MTSNFTCVVLVWPQSRQLVLVLLQGSKQPPGKQARKGKKTAGKAAKGKQAAKKSKKSKGGQKSGKGGKNGKKSGKTAAKSKKQNSKSSKKNAKSGKNKAKKNKKQGKSSKKKAKGGQKKGKKAAKKAGKKSKKVGKHSKKSKKQGAKADRQTSSCGVADVISAIKKFTLYTTNLNQNKRIRSFVNLGQAKLNKAPTAFVGAAAVMQDATGGGSLCNGASPNTSVLATFNKLQNCDKTAAQLCNVALTAAQNATVTSCATSLTNYTTAFQVRTHPFMGSGTCYQLYGQPHQLYHSLPGEVTPFHEFIDLLVVTSLTNYTTAF